MPRAVSDECMVDEPRTPAVQSAGDHESTRDENRDDRYAKGHTLPPHRAFVSRRQEAP
jgi:hypothetical protein